MRISASAARRLALRCQGLDGNWGLAKGKEGVAQVIERLGYVQIDTIAVVQRAHHHTLWSRHSEYDHQMLHELQAEDRRVFEYWARAAAYIPMRDYRYYLPRMRAHHRGARTRRWLEGNRELVAGVVDRIRAEGPLGSADFEAPEGFKRGTWWSWKPAKRALETLFSMGELMVTERRNFQRIYDLTERVLPVDVDAGEPDPGEVGRFQVRRVLAGLGVAPAGEVWWARGDRELASRALEELTDAGEVARLEMEGTDGEPYYALTKTVEEAAEHPEGRARLHILSPFDNLVIRRGWLAGVFGFEYSLECYTPRAKRRYGYFCLPILWGDRFVGRLDAKADRKGKTLLVRGLIFEPGFEDYEEFLPALAERLYAFAAFNACNRVVVERTEPEVVKDPLVRELGEPSTS